MHFQAQAILSLNCYIMVVSIIYYTELQFQHYRCIIRIPQASSYKLETWPPTSFSGKSACIVYLFNKKPISPKESLLHILSELPIMREMHNLYSPANTTTVSRLSQNCNLKQRGKLVHILPKRDFCSFDFMLKKTQFSSQ